MDTIDQIRESFSHPLKIEGILLTMYDERTKLTRQVADDLEGVLSGRSPQDGHSAKCPARRRRPVLGSQF
jgi:cellulose biosynthesis protein BcsQ